MDGNDDINGNVFQEAKEFERSASKIMGRRLGISLRPGSVQGVPKEFDLVSSDGQFIGDAKYFTLVGGKRLPPAKFATIAEYVWLLEKADAKGKFLVFGNQIEVPLKWLKKYGHLVNDVDFFFLSANGGLKKLN